MTDSDSAKEASKISLQPPRGTYDILPVDTELWQYLEATARLVFQEACYREIRTPIFEQTELFSRGVGNSSDIVNKEMYTFADKSNRSLTLRPEGTAGAVRAFLNGGLHRLSPPIKLWYIGPMFRYESIKVGRQRQFHQISVEVFGSQGPLIDAEIILVATTFLKKLGASGLTVNINSIGCPDCRPKYRQLLVDKYMPLLSKLCVDCNDRIHKNPLRLLDCKNETCQQYYKDAPLAIDHLCGVCQTHFDGLKDLLSHMHIDYVINPKLVRGFDYYTRTVFEIISNDPRLGVESTICGGGRYDNLVELFGGQPTPAVGWSIGAERLLSILNEKRTSTISTFIVSTNQIEALKLAIELRENGISCDLDYPSQGAGGRNFTKQLQQANKSGAHFAIILGEEELSSRTLTIKDMKTSEQRLLKRDELINFINKGPK